MKFSFLCFRGKARTLQELGPPHGGVPDPASKHGSVWAGLFYNEESEDWLEVESFLSSAAETDVPVSGGPPTG